jgi:hypothetical protein
LKEETTVAIAVVLIIFGAVLVIASPIVLSRGNPGRLIPRKENQGIAKFYVTFLAGAAAVILGAILVEAPLLAFVALAVVLPLPLQYLVRKHNSKLS